MQDDEKNSGVLSSILTELGVLPPEGSSLEAMAVERQEIIGAYQAGRITEEEFRRHFSDDPALAKHLAQTNQVDRGDQ